MSQQREKYKHAVHNVGGRATHTARITIGEFLRIALQEGSHREYPTLGFCGVSTFEEAEKIQQEGYIPPAGVVRMPPVMADNDSVYMERSVIGQFPDVAAYLRGEPESMFNMVFEPRPTPTIHLAIMMNVTIFVSAKDQQKHADAVYNCIRHLQAQGNQVTLTALFYNSFGSGVYEELQVEILRENQVLSAATLGARFHLSFYRVCWFSWANLHFGNCGGSRTPPEYVDAGKRLVIPSFEFMPVVDGKKQSVEAFVTDALKKRAAV